MDQCDYRFSRREVREYVGWTDFQIKTHMKKLEQMEYLLVHRGGRGQSFVYELLYNGEGQQGERFLMGLTNINEATHYAYDEKKEHTYQKKEPSSSIQVAHKEPPSRIALDLGITGLEADYRENSKNARLDPKKETCES